MRKIVSPIPAVFLIAAQCSAQTSPQTVNKPEGPLLIRSYQTVTVPPVNLRNSDHLHNLIRAGHLYLTVQDAIALAIENNVDLEVDRYGPLTAQWGVERYLGGGALRGVTNGNALVNQATSGQGVIGSEISAGLASNNSNGGASSGGATISQIGPVTQNLDPAFQIATDFSHTTTLLPSTIVSQTAALVDTQHLVKSFFQEGLLSGGYIQVGANESYLKENAPSDYLNPSVAPVSQIYVFHNLLNGFGAGVNGRFIRVAQKNVQAAQEMFRSQLLNTVANVSNLYWDLVTDDDDLSIRQRAVEQAQKLYDDTRREIGIGVVARFEASRAQAVLTNSQQQLAIAKAAAQKQETLLKDAISRDGLEDPLLDAAEVVTLDHISVPDEESLPLLRDLVLSAMANRPDIALAKINDETSEISAVGTANGLLPTLQGRAIIGASGLSGNSAPYQGIAADPYYVGGLGNALGQVLRDDFPNRRASVVFYGTINNRVAQGDYGVEQLQLRQGDLIERRNMNQIVVDISNNMVALRQARARYSQAVDSRKLQQELLDDSQRLFAFGSATISDVVAAQTSLVAAQEAEVTTLSAYSHARIALDQVLGRTLDVNHISVEQALVGISATGPKR